MKSIKINFLVVVLCAVFGAAVQAKLYTPEFERNFFNQIQRHDLAVVHFNPYVEDEINEPALDRMKDGFFSLSKSDRYKGADVGFIGVNLSKLPELAKDYGIELPVYAAPVVVSAQKAEMQKGAEVAAQVAAVDLELAAPERPVIKKSQQSTVILFKDGKPLQEKGVIVKRTGFMTRTEMEDFIEAYFGEYIDNILKQNKNAERQREQVRVTQPSTTTIYRYPASSYYSSGYYSRPYYGGGYYGGGYGRGWGGGGWGGSGIGFGFGGGGRGGWGGIGFGW